MKVGKKNPCICVCEYQTGSSIYSDKMYAVDNNNCFS